MSDQALDITIASALRAGREAGCRSVRVHAGGARLLFQFPLSQCRRAGGVEGQVGAEVQAGAFIAALRRRLPAGVGPHFVSTAVVAAALKEAAGGSWPYESDKMVVNVVSRWLERGEVLHMRKKRKSNGRGFVVGKNVCVAEE